MRSIRFVVVTLLVAVCWLGGQDQLLKAENWPGWRKDGSGVSRESDLPVEWSREQNVRWQVPIPGQGHSSPIVWDDLVIVTSVRPTVELHPWTPAALIALSLLCGLALWRLTDGTMADPLGNRSDVWALESATARVARRVGMWLVFVVVSYGTVLGVELSYDALEKYPESLRNRVIDKTWYFTDAPGAEDLDTPISPHRAITGREVEGPFFGSPRIPLACFYGGALAIVVMLSLNSIIARRYRMTETPGPLEHVPARRLLGLRVNVLGLGFNLGIRAEQPLFHVVRTLVAWFAAIIAGCFLISIHSAAMANLPFAPSGATWFLATAIGVLGLMAFVLTMPSRPLLRAVAVLITVALIGYAAVAAPPNEEFGIYATAQRAGMRPLLKLLIVACGIGLFAAWIAPIKSSDREDHDGKRQWSAGLMSVAMLIGSCIYFYLANFMIPSRVDAREVIAIHRETGNVQWTARCDSGEISSAMHAANTMATPTPVTDGERIIAHFGESGLFCLDMNGDVQWRFDEPAQPSHWGAASSPIIWQDLVIMTYDLDDVSMTVGVDMESGEEKWRTNRTAKIEPSQLMDGYSTPIIIERDGQPELVHVACKLLEGYDPASGEERWSFAHAGEQPVATPVVSGDRIIALGGRYAPYFGAIRIDSTTGSDKPEELWQGTRNLSDMPSPVVYNGLLFMVTKEGIASCIDVETGDYQWRRRLKGAFWSSVTAAGGHVYFCNALGSTTVVAASAEYQEISTNELGEEVYSSFAVSNGEIFVRTSGHLFCISSKDR